MLELGAMFFAVVDTESLIDPRLINSYEPFKVEIEYEPNSDSNKYHHVLFLTINDQELKKQIKHFSSQIKDGWYAFFWNANSLYIVFNKHNYLIRIPFSKKDPDYQMAQKYGRSVGIQEEFLNFIAYWERYNKLALNFLKKQIDFNVIFNLPRFVYYLISIFCPKTFSEAFLKKYSWPV